MAAPLRAMSHRIRRTPLSARVEAHLGVPMAGGVLDTINMPLDPDTIANILGHAKTRVLIADTQFAPSVCTALAMLTKRDPDSRHHGDEGLPPRPGGDANGFRQRRSRRRASRPLRRGQGLAKRRHCAGASAADSAIIACCRQRLAGFKTPEQVIFGEPPRTATGKIRKFGTAPKSKGASVAA